MESSHTLPNFHNPTALRASEGCSPICTGENLGLKRYTGPPRTTYPRDSPPLSHLSDKEWPFPVTQFPCWLLLGVKGKSHTELPSGHPPSGPDRKLVGPTGVKSVAQGPGSVPTVGPLIRTPHDNSECPGSFHPHEEAGPIPGCSPKITAGSREPPHPGPAPYAPAA